MTQQSIAELVARGCAAHGVKRAFGVPGGGSSLDLIEAFDRHGIDFVLCRTETGAALMAAADAELRHGFGVAVATQGPGAASAMNGLAHASLDRAPVLFISDGWTDAQRALDAHQVFDQHAMSAPVVKAAARLESEAPALEFDRLVDAMLAAPWGPAHLVLTGANAKRRVVIDATAPPRPAPASAPQPQTRLQADATALLARAKRPVVLLGLEAREPRTLQQVVRLVQQLHCPVLTTYKAKGLFSDDAEWTVGHVTGGAAERATLDAADLVLSIGLDPVELIGPVRCGDTPVLELALFTRPVQPVRAAASLLGPLAPALASLLPECRRSQWSSEEIAALRLGMRERLGCAGGEDGAALSPQAVVEVALDAAASPRPAITVDAGAHMFSAMALWRADVPGGALISNGLATMGFALPAAIARALHDPARPTLAFTGDGGLMMCAGELATAAQQRARLCVVVFNDGALSLIALKQRNRGMAPAGVGWSRADFADVARGFGLRAFSVHDEAGYRQALRAALDHDGPSLIDVRVDPTGYQAQARALRG
ncbi:thiamine pyrophosphate-binding protein [Variovorax paradoxus]|uniref:thiamine pyrophosphate-binding protein n=1 Tax=Variovorax paradoxus TaxID=34073 RepID=UPI0019323724|nr:thiamine pyrophosphate-binding protein [Variovorax paradoxus]